MLLLGGFAGIGFIAPSIGGVPGHFGVAAGGTDEPFSVGTGGHFLKGITVGAVGAANHFCGGLARTAHSEKPTSGEAEAVEEFVRVLELA